MPVNNSPQISFVVPCYNYARYLPDCLNSILKQEGNFDYEIIVIDDASTDNTIEVVRSYTDQRIRFLANEVNLGHAKTINKGLAEARGEFIARIDPDDRYRLNYLSLVMPKFAQFPEVGMVYGDAAVINGEGVITIERCDQIHGGKDVKGNELITLLEKNFICAPTVMARAEAWLNALPAPEWLAFNDWYFTLKMAREYDFYYIDQVLADYRVHSQNHHHKVVVNKSEEPSIFWLLDHIYGTPEKFLPLESKKQQARRRIYGSQYLDMATKYFGCQYDADARRCFWHALQYRPAYAMRPPILRQFLGTIIGRRLYESIKMHIKTVLTPLMSNWL
ncbi:MAG: glycosyltransferase [Acidobacteria bacterium]|nr:glycosyltransferase [Acidobacteriota bacterium]MBI3425584.1 glycosyltransferase [Acidobacteriota bacterium]